MSALNAYNKLNANVAGLKSASEKLSSGYRINRAGDDAAGLAISEKMRSQIKGLNQAVRNSQDGINMIQTFEGAAQETHSILQRMKELASESANGTYDNATDRAAIQLEFEQLNDELNQIADTDFNGTVVLNGGEMSDGLTQVDGTFDYANKEAQILAAANAQYTSDLSAAQEAYSTAVSTFNSTAYDLTENGTAPEHNTVDNNLYTKTEADAIWKAAGLTTDGTNNGTVTTAVVNQITATYEYDSENDAWTLSSAIGNDGVDYADGLGTALAAKGTENGGIEITAAKVNVVADLTSAKSGDTISVVFTNSDPTKYAPTNIGFNQDSVEVTSTGTAAIEKESVTAEVETINDDDMTQEIADIYAALEDAEVSVTYDGTATSSGYISIGGQAATTTGGTITINGTDMYALDKADGTVKIYASDQDTLLLTITSNVTKDATAIGSWTGNISIDAYGYAEAAGVTAYAGDNEELGTSTEAQAAVDTAKAALTALQDTKITDYASAKEYLASKGVSVSDSYDNSTAILTYAEDITLQTGARSKDSVNFTFSYNVDDTADMGDPKANLNISARADGLNTENLSLATADDANYAIDQIDKAINKVSMVRATFGSIQNRLDHKINNLTTTSENLTEAESAIRDTDMASEMMNYTKYNILQQAAQSMLAQANQQPQTILQLLG